MGLRQQRNPQDHAAARDRRGLLLLMNGSTGRGGDGGGGGGGAWSPTGTSPSLRNSKRG